MNTNITEKQFENIIEKLEHSAGNITTIIELVTKVVTRFDGTLDDMDTTLENINSVVDQLQLTLFFVWGLLILLVILPTCCTIICLCKK